MYTEDLLEESRSPANYGHLSNPTVTVSEKNSSCGDEIVVDVLIKEKNNQQLLSDLKWQGSGCAISQASMSLLSQHIIGKSISEINQLQQSDLESFLGLEQPISYGRIKCLTLGLQAVKKSITLLSEVQ